MTKAELLIKLQDVPDDEQILVFDYGLVPLASVHSMDTSERYIPEVIKDKKVTLLLNEKQPFLEFYGKKL